MSKSEHIGLRVEERTVRRLDRLARCLTEELPGVSPGGFGRSAAARMALETGLAAEESARGLAPIGDGE